MAGRHGEQVGMGRSSHWLRRHQGIPDFSNLLCAPWLYVWSAMLIVQQARQDPLRATLFPAGAVQPQRNSKYGTSSALRTDDVTSQLSVGVLAVVSAYKSARFERLAARDFSFESLTTEAVVNAFSDCIGETRSFF